MCPSKAAPMEVPLGRTQTLNWDSARVSSLARDGGSDPGVDLLEPGGWMASRLPDLDLGAVPDIDNALDHIHRHLRALTLNAVTPVRDLCNCWNSK